jgi:hypothetical protein
MKDVLLTQNERFGRVKRSIDKEVLSNSLEKNSFIEWVNCNNFQIGVYLSKVLYRYAQIAQLRIKSAVNEIKTRP